MTWISVISATRDARWCLDVEADISYGSTERQKLDVYTLKNSVGKKGEVNFSFKQKGFGKGGGGHSVLFI